jgi:nicotinamidase-related amidase
VVKRTPDAFHGTDLHEILQENGVKALAIAGIQTEFCVDTTCRRAFSLRAGVQGKPGGSDVGVAGGVERETGQSPRL